MTLVTCLNLNPLLTAFMYIYFSRSDLCALLEAEEGSQVPVLLEHLPSLHRLHHHHTRSHQHLQGNVHPECRPEVEDGLHHCHLHPGRHCLDPGSRYMGHCLEAEERGQQDLQWQWERPLAGIYVMTP